MSAAGYDNLMEVIKEAFENAASNKEIFCKWVAQCVDALDRRYLWPYEQEAISEFMQYISDGQYEERTLALGRDLLKIFEKQTMVRFIDSKRKYVTSVRFNISSLRFKGTALNIIQKTLQITAIVGATSIPFILNIQDISKLIPTVISIIVATATALISYFKFGDFIVFYQQSARKMQQEYNLYKSGRKYYADLKRGEALDLFMDKIDELRYEQNKLSLELAKSSQEQEQKIEDLVKISKQ